MKWHSQSTTDVSQLDQTINEIEVCSQQQYQEILNMHAIVDQQNRRISTPRFTIYIFGGGAAVVDPLSPQPAIDLNPSGWEANAEEQMALSMSNIVDRDSPFCLAKSISGGAAQQEDQQVDPIEER